MAALQMRACSGYAAAEARSAKRRATTDKIFSSKAAPRLAVLIVCVLVCLITQEGHALTLEWTGEGSTLRDKVFPPEGSLIPPTPPQLRAAPGLSEDARKKLKQIEANCSKLCRKLALRADDVCIWSDGSTSPSTPARSMNNSGALPCGCPPLADPPITRACCALLNVSYVLTAYHACACVPPLPQAWPTHACSTATHACSMHAATLHPWHNDRYMQLQRMVEHPPSDESRQLDRHKLKTPCTHVWLISPLYLLAAITLILLACRLHMRKRVLHITPNMHIAQGSAPTPDASKPPPQPKPVARGTPSVALKPGKPETMGWLRLGLGAWSVRVQKNKAALPKPTPPSWWCQPTPTAHQEKARARRKRRALAKQLSQPNWPLIAGIFPLTLMALCFQPGPQTKRLCLPARKRKPLARQNLAPAKAGDPPQQSSTSPEAAAGWHDLSALHYVTWVASTTRPSQTTPPSPPQQKHTSHNSPNKRASQGMGGTRIFRQHKRLYWRTFIAPHVEAYRARTAAAEAEAQVRELTRSRSCPDQAPPLPRLPPTNCSETLACNCAEDPSCSCTTMAPQQVCRGGTRQPTTWADRVRHLANLPGALYYEKQVQCHCNIHALNMLLGGRHHNIGEVFSWIHQQKRTPMYEHHRESWRNGEAMHLFTERTGALSPQTFAYWLFACLGLDMRVIWYKTDIATITLARLDAELDRLKTLEGYQYDGFLVGTREEADYGHNTTLIRHQGQWYWLDPEKIERARLSGTSPQAAHNLATLRAVAVDVATLRRATSFDECRLIHQAFSPVPHAYARVDLVDLVGPDPAPQVRVPTAAPTAPLAPALPSPAAPQTGASPTLPDPMEIDPQPRGPPAQHRKPKAPMTTSLSPKTATTRIVMKRPASRPTRLGPQRTLDQVWAPCSLPKATIPPPSR